MCVLWEREERGAVVAFLSFFPVVSAFICKLCTLSCCYMRLKMRRGGVESTIVLPPDR